MALYGIMPVTAVRDLVLDHPPFVFMLLPSVKDAETDTGTIIGPLSISTSFTEGRSMKTISG